MTRVGWWAVNAVSRMLEPDEREAVRGDLAESGEAAGWALAGVVGLVFRRQISFWKDWRPWLALVGLVLPLGLLLGLNSVWIGRSYDLHLWIIRNYGVIDTVILRDTGLLGSRKIIALVCHSLLLVGWSWSAGFVLGSLSRRATRVNGALFCFMLLLGEVSGAPRYHYFVAGEEFAAKTLWSVILPLVLLSILVMIPSLWGMRQGHRLSTIRLPYAVLLAFGMATLIALGPSALWWWNWPAAYLLITAGSRWWRENTRG